MPSMHGSSGRSGGRFGGRRDWSDGWERRGRRRARFRRGSPAGFAAACGSARCKGNEQDGLFRGTYCGFLRRLFMQQQERHPDGEESSGQRSGFRISTPLLFFVSLFFFSSTQSGRGFYPPMDVGFHRRRTDSRRGACLFARESRIGPGYV
jgi:hypothetical protein